MKSVDEFTSAHFKKNVRTVPRAHACPVVCCLALPACKLGGEFAEEVRCGTGAGMGQRAGITGQSRGGWWGMSRQPTLPELTTMKSAAHSGASAQAGPLG